MMAMSRAGGPPTASPGGTIQVTKTCMLCTKERFFIIRKPNLASLNVRQEIGAHCLHIASNLLKTVMKVKV